MTTNPRIPAIAARIECDPARHPDTDRLLLTFADGREVVISPADHLTSSIIRYATLHGLKQKLVDAAAISRDPETGRTASPADKIAAVQEVLDRLLAGEWNKRREGGATGGLLLRALMRMQPAKTREQLIEWLGTKSDAEKAALRRNPKVAAVIEEIRAEDGDDGATDSDAMLDEIL